MAPRPPGQEIDGNCGVAAALLEPWFQGFPRRELTVIVVWLWALFNSWYEGVLGRELAIIQEIMAGAAKPADFQGYGIVRRGCRIV